MVHLDLSSEDKLLLYCSRLSISEDIKYKIEEILSRDLDWNYVVDCSVKQGISPLFYWNLKKIKNNKSIPSEVMQKLEKMYYNTLARNMIRYQELHKILTAFKEAGIDVVVLKGAFLAEHIYQNIGLRPMSDVDLLIKEKDLGQAEIELTNLRYSYIDIYPTKLHERQYRIKAGEATLISQDKNIAIDLHWNLQLHEYNDKVDINKFWSNTKSVKIGGVEALTLACEDILQYLCLHVDKHITLSSTSNHVPPAKPLRDYCDIAEVTKHYKNTINWDCLLQSSINYGVERPVYQGLYIAKKYFGGFVPENVLITLESIEPLIINFGEIYRGAMGDRCEKEKQWGERTYLARLKKVDGYYNKVRIVFGEIFPSKEYMIYRYFIKNDRQIYRHYLIRLGKCLQFGLYLLQKLPRRLFESTCSK